MELGQILKKRERREFLTPQMDHPHEGDMTDGDRARIVGEWVEEHASLVYRFAYRLCGSAADAEDLVQQAFLTAQRKFDQLRDGEKVRPGCSPSSGTTTSRV